MARKAVTEKRAEWEVDFVHIELDAAQKLQVQKWDVDGAASVLALDNHLLAGCKLSLVHDTRNNCIIASITTAKSEDGGRQKCLSARGPDLVSALRVLAFKTEKVLDGDLSAMGEVAEARSQWG